MSVLEIKSMVWRYGAKAIVRGGGLQGERRLRLSHDLLALRGGAPLLEGEVLLEAWAADRSVGLSVYPGLLLLTDWRVIFIETDGRLSAFPILKIDVVRRTGTAELTITAWYGCMQLAFDHQATASSVETCLRHDPRSEPAGVRVVDALAGPRDGDQVAAAPLSTDRPLMMLEPSL